jgi:NDP-4-keto-2,6-dideoxyhexose 3-C-methyltransferase
MKHSYRSVGSCRICGNTNLVDVLDLGKQYLTGVFPRTAEETHLTKGPLQLVECQGGKEACGLVQLRHHKCPVKN